MPSAPPLAAVTDTLHQIRRTYFSAPWRRADGGFARTVSADSDFWSTAEALILACRFGDVEVQTVDAAVDFLLCGQNADGGWSASDGPSDTTGTALALLSLLPMRSDGRVRRCAERALKWLDKAQNLDGGWPLVPVSKKTKDSTMFTTAFAYEAVAAWYIADVGSTAEVTGMLTIGSARLSSAGLNSLWGINAAGPPTVRHTSYVALANMSPSLEGSRYFGSVQIEHGRVIRWLKERQHTNGTWGEGREGDVESTAAATRALLRLGCRPDSRAVRAGVAALLKWRRRELYGGFTITGWAPGDLGPITSWNTFYAASTLMDYKEAHDRSNEYTSIRVRKWRKYLAAPTVLLTIAAIIAVLSIAQLSRWATAALVASVAVANIVAAYPIVSNWLRRPQ